MMESILRDAMMDHFNTNKMLSNNQYGFWSKRSTTLQLLRVLDDWTQSMDRRKDIDVIYLDFSKAFDTVPHVRLMKKLEAYGIQGMLWCWVEDFLRNRRQKVTVNGASSDWLKVHSGIPQGSVLGPLLFVLYINDMPDVLENMAMMFADDSKVYAEVANLEDQQKLQRDVDSLMAWSEKWQLRFNVDKCKVVHYGRRNPCYPYEMSKEGAAQLLAEDTEEKDLGVLFDTTLKFSKHVAMIASKANRMVGLIRRSFKFMDKPTFICLYKAMIRPHLEYEVPVWNPLLKGDSDHLEKVQRRATKLLPEIRDLPYEERLRHLELPTLTYRRKCGDMIETFKIMQGYVDITPETFFITNPHSRTRGNSKKIEVQRSRTQIRNHFFSQRVVKDWNMLTEDVISAPSVNAFKGKLDRFWAHLSCKYQYRSYVFSSTEFYGN
jgi:ribonuclease P/MRP protein subunit RPP40